MDNMSNIGSGDNKINKIAHNTPILRGILKRCTTSGMELHV
jgi:hypothetical protein